MVGQRSISCKLLEKQTGYKTALKATTVFGGVQIFIVLINIIKSKLVAVWLGTVGYGIMGLFNSTVNLIYSITNLGLQNSAVRDIASVEVEGNIIQIAKIVKAINRWVVITGLLGVLVTIALSPYLSRWLFDNNGYIISFILLSSVVLLTGIYNGHYALLQGTRNIKLMAKASMFGALVGCMCSLPLLYFFRENGIVWALILTALSITIISFMYAKQVRLIAVKQSYKESFFLGLGSIKLGLMMSISNIMAYLVEFVVKAFITHIGGIEDVGLYQAGWAINVGYLGLVFTAMSKDYFPRLSQISRDNLIIKDRVNQQAEIAIIIMTPMIAFLLVFLSSFIKIIYTNQFLLIIPMTKWLLIGSLMKAGSWAVSYIFLAKGDGKTFLFNEVGIQFITLPSYLLGYYCGGLEGIGYAFIFNYVVYFAWVGIIAYKKYSFTYSYCFWKLFITLIVIVSLYGIFESSFPYIWRYVLGSIFVITISLFALFALNKRVDLLSVIKYHK